MATATAEREYRIVSIRLDLTPEEAQALRTVLGHSFSLEETGLSSVFHALEDHTVCESAPRFVLTPSPARF